jgi:hypothetical protein
MIVQRAVSFIVHVNNAASLLLLSLPLLAGAYYLLKLLHRVFGEIPGFVRIIVWILVPFLYAELWFVVGDVEGLFWGMTLDEWIKFTVSAGALAWVHYHLYVELRKVSASRWLHFWNCALFVMGEALMLFSVLRALYPRDLAMSLRLFNRNTTTAFFLVCVVYLSSLIYIALKCAMASRKGKVTAMESSGEGS